MINDKSIELDLVSYEQRLVRRYKVLTRVDTRRKSELTIQH